MAFGTFCRGYLILVKNDGENDSQFPVISDTCCIGRSIECDIRLRDINISDKHCLVKISTNKKITVHSLCSENPVLLNNKPVGIDGSIIQNGDLIKILDYTFRWENVDFQNVDIISGRNSLQTSQKYLTEITEQKRFSAPELLYEIERQENNHYRTFESTIPDDANENQSVLQTPKCFKKAYHSTPIIGISRNDSFLDLEKFTNSIESPHERKNETTAVYELDNKSLSASLVKLINGSSIYLSDLSHTSVDKDLYSDKSKSKKKESELMQSVSKSSRRYTRGTSNILKKTFEEHSGDNLVTSEKSLTTPEKLTTEVTSDIIKTTEQTNFESYSPEKKTEFMFKFSAENEIGTFHKENCEKTNKFDDSNITRIKCTRNLSYLSPPENNKSQEFMDSVVSTPKKMLLNDDGIVALSTCITMSSSAKKSINESVSELMPKSLQSSCRNRRSTDIVPCVGTPSEVYRTTNGILTPANKSRFNRTSMEVEVSVGPRDSLSGLRKSSKYFSRKQSSERKLTPVKTDKSYVRDSVQLHSPIIEDYSLENEEENENENMSIDSKFKFVSRRRRRFLVNSFGVENRIMEENETNSPKTSGDEILEEEESLKPLTSLEEENSAVMATRIVVNSDFNMKNNEISNSDAIIHANDTKSRLEIRDDSFGVKNMLLKSILTPLPRMPSVTKEKNEKKVTFRDVKESRHGLTSLGYNIIMNDSEMDSELTLSFSNTVDNSCVSDVQDNNEKQDNSAESEKLYLSDESSSSFTYLGHSELSSDDMSVSKSFNSIQSKYIKHASISPEDASPCLINERNPSTLPTFDYSDVSGINKLMETTENETEFLKIPEETISFSEEKAEMEKCSPRINIGDLGTSSPKVHSPISEKNDSTYKSNNSALSTLITRRCSKHFRIHRTSICQFLDSSINSTMHETKVHDCSASLDNSIVEEKIGRSESVTVIQSPRTIFRNVLVQLKNKFNKLPIGKEHQNGSEMNKDYINLNNTSSCNTALIENSSNNSVISVIPSIPVKDNSTLEKKISGTENTIIIQTPKAVFKNTPEQFKKELNKLLSDEEYQNESEMNEDCINLNNTSSCNTALIENSSNNSVISVIPSTPVKDNSTLEEKISETENTITIQTPKAVFKNTPEQFKKELNKLLSDEEYQNESEMNEDCINLNNTSSCNTALIENSSNNSVISVIPSTPVKDNFTLEEKISETENTIIIQTPKAVFKNTPEQFKKELNKLLSDEEYQNESEMNEDCINLNNTSSCNTALIENSSNNSVISVIPSTPVKDNSTLEQKISETENTITIQTPKAVFKNTPEQFKKELNKLLSDEEYQNENEMNEDCINLNNTSSCNTALIENSSNNSVISVIPSIPVKDNSTLEEKISETENTIIFQTPKAVFKNTPEQFKKELNKLLSDEEYQNESEMNEDCINLNNTSSCNTALTENSSNNSVISVIPSTPVKDNSTLEQKITEIEGTAITQTLKTGSKHVLEQLKEESVTLHQECRSESKIIEDNSDLKKINLSKINLIDNSNVEISLISVTPIKESVPIDKNSYKYLSSSNGDFEHESQNVTLSKKHLSNKFSMRTNETFNTCSSVSNSALVIETDESITPDMNIKVIDVSEIPEFKKSRCFVETQVSPITNKNSPELVSSSLCISNSECIMKDTINAVLINKNDKSVIKNKQAIKLDSLVESENAILKDLASKKEEEVSENMHSLMENNTFVNVLKETVCINKNTENTSKYSANVANESVPSHSLSITANNFTTTEEKISDLPCIVHDNIQKIQTLCPMAESTRVGEEIQITIEDGFPNLASKSFDNNKFLGRKLSVVIENIQNIGSTSKRKHSARNDKANEIGAQDGNVNIISKTNQEEQRRSTRSKCKINNLKSTQTVIQLENQAGLSSASAGTKDGQTCTNLLEKETKPRLVLRKTGHQRNAEFKPEIKRSMRLRSNENVCTSSLIKQKVILQKKIKNKPDVDKLVLSPKRKRLVDELNPFSITLSTNQKNDHKILKNIDIKVNEVEKILDLERINVPELNIGKSRSGYNTRRIKFITNNENPAENKSENSFDKKKTTVPARNMRKTKCKNEINVFSKTAKEVNSPTAEKRKTKYQNVEKVAIEEIQFCENDCTKRKINAKLDVFQKEFINYSSKDVNTNKIVRRTTRNANKILLKSEKMERVEIVKSKKYIKRGVKIIESRVSKLEVSNQKEEKLIHDDKQIALEESKSKQKIRKLNDNNRKITRNQKDKKNVLIPSRSLDDKIAVDKDNEMNMFNKTRTTRNCKINSYKEASSNLTKIKNVPCSISVDVVRANIPQIMAKKRLLLSNTHEELSEERNNKKIKVCETSPQVSNNARVTRSKKLVLEKENNIKNVSKTKRENTIKVISKKAKLLKMDESSLIENSNNIAEIKSKSTKSKLNKKNKNNVLSKNETVINDGIAKLTKEIKKGGKKKSTEKIFSPISRVTRSKNQSTYITRSRRAKK